MSSLTGNIICQFLVTDYYYVKHFKIFNLILMSQKSKKVQPWDFFGRNDAKAETLVLWPPHVKSWLIGKDFDAGRDWGKEKKAMTKDEMAGWHHWLYGSESEWTPGDDDGQGGLGCCDSWGRKELDTTEQLTWTELKCPWSFTALSSGTDTIT